MKLPIVCKLKLKGGTAILLHNSISDKVQEHGILIPERLQFIVLHVETNLRVGVMCIYAYNDSPLMEKNS